MDNETKGVRERALEMNRWIAEGRLMEAFEEFYADDVVMQENLEPPVRGKDANREREREFLASVAEFRGYEVKALAAERDVSFAETVMDFVSQDGQEVHSEQVSRALWRDGRIIDERFYHG